MTGATLEAFDIRRSLSHKDCPYDNVVTDATFKIIKNEFVKNQSFDGLYHLQLAFADYVNWFNNHRIHPSPNYHTPVSFRNNVLKKLFRKAKLLTIQASLLDSYLGCLFNASSYAASLCPENATSNDSHVSAHLLMYCTDELEQKKTEGNATSEYVRDFINTHPLSFQERTTTRSLYFSLLIHDYYDSIVYEYQQEIIHNLTDHFDTCEIRELHQTICSLMDDDESLEKLKNLFFKCFFLVTPMEIFTQCFNQNLLYALVHRDRETSKQVFQLLLESDFPY